MLTPEGCRTGLVAAFTAACLLLGGCAQEPSPSTPSASAALTANHRLLIHCGIQWATFDGDTWEAVAPIPSIAPYVDGRDGTSGSRNEIAGVMVRNSATEATFTTTEPPAGMVIHFVRTTAEQPMCA